MSTCLVKFEGSSTQIEVTKGALLSEAVQLAGLDMLQPCGGPGRCGRCVVQVLDGAVRRRSTLRLSAEDLEQGYALACQTVIEGDTTIHVPPQEKVERRLTTDRTVAEVSTPPGYDFQRHQSIPRIKLQLKEPSMDDQSDDLSRLMTSIRQQVGYERVQVSLPLIQKLGSVLRQGNWQVTALLYLQDESLSIQRLIDLIPGWVDETEPLWGAAIDIGTTTVTLWLVDLISGQVHAQVSEYNGQIIRGEDVISRIVYASKNGGEE